MHCGMRRSIFNFVNVILLLSSLGNEHDPSFEETCVLFTQRCFVLIKFSLNWPSGSGLLGRWKCEKFTQDQWTDKQTNGQQAFGKAHLSFQLGWAKKLPVKCCTCINYHFPLPNIHPVIW